MPRHWTLTVPGRAAVAWGASVAALGSAPVNDLPQARFGSGGWLAVLGAPLVEEMAKAGVLLALVQVWRTEVRGLRAGIVVGALVGWGFCLAENVPYLLVAAVSGGIGRPRACGLGARVPRRHRAPAVRGVHGAGLGRDRAAAGGRTALVGFGAAVVQHGLWNGVGARAVTAILCNGVGPGGMCRGDPDVLRLAVVVPLVVIAALGPGAVTLVVLARRGG